MPVMMCFQDPPRVESLNHTWIPHVNNLRSKLMDGKSAEAAGETSAASLETIEQEAVSLLNEYLRVDTTNPPGNEIKAAQFFKDIFDREGIEAQIIEAAPGRGNIYARLKGDGSKKAIVLMNHMDVVPADRRYWSVDPFGGVVKDGYVWGRGALDMKGRWERHCRPSCLRELTIRHCSLRMA
jgi:hypothetical protein